MHDATLKIKKIYVKVIYITVCKTSVIQRT